MWVFWLVFFVLMAVVITLMYCCLIRARACLKNKNCTKRMFHFPFS